MQREKEVVVITKFSDCVLTRRKISSFFVLELSACVAFRKMKKSNPARRQNSSLLVLCVNEGQDKFDGNNRLKLLAAVL